MSEINHFAVYRDLLDEAEDAELLPTVRALEQAYPHVAPPPQLIARIRAAAHAPSASRKHWWRGTRQPVRRSVALAVMVALAFSLLGGAVYAMRVFGGSPRAHVVQSCTGFGAHWTLSGVGVRMMAPSQFVATGGKLVPNWQRQVVGLQRPQYWVTPANADVVDTCGGSSSVQNEIGTNQRRGTQLLAISVTPMWLSNRPVMVGELLFPPHSGCTPKPASAPIKAPSGQAVAQLSRIPAGFARSITVTFPPCKLPKHFRRPTGLVPAAHEVSFAILSQIQYSGHGGTITVVTTRPSPTATRLGLDLGTPIGKLPDGTRLYQLASNVPDFSWLDHGLIISISATEPLRQRLTAPKRLEALAADVVLR